MAPTPGFDKNYEQRMTRVETILERLDEELLGPAGRIQGLKEDLGELKAAYTLDLKALRRDVEQQKQFRWKSTGALIGMLALIQIAARILWR